MDTRIQYAWVAMKDGELLSGMYTVGDAAATPELARLTAKPHAAGASDHALCEFELQGERMVRRTILAIEPKDSTPPVVWTYMGITAHAALWQTLGFREYTNVPFAEKPCRDGFAPSDGELVEARVASGSSTDTALVWLRKETARKREESARVAAMRQQGDDAIHAARIQRQAEELRCLANGVSREVIGKVLS